MEIYGRKEEIGVENKIRKARKNDSQKSKI